MSVEKPAAPPSNGDAASARVVMLETVTHEHTRGLDDHADTGVLLRWMDICTCASAEAYSAALACPVAHSYKRLMPMLSGSRLTAISAASVCRFELRRAACTCASCVAS